MSVHRLVGLAAICAALISCRPRPEDVISRHRSAAEAQLGHLEAIGKLVKAAAPLESDQMPPLDPQPVFPPYFGKHNAVAMAAEHFDDLKTEPKEYRLVTHNPVADAVSLLGGGTFADGSRPTSDTVAKVEETLQRFAALRYVLVLRTTGGEEPRSLGTDFEGGRWEGEATLYDVTAQRRLGGFTFVAENDEKVQVDREKAGAWLLANLRENALAVVRAELERRFPQGNAPFADEATGGPAR